MTRKILKPFFFRRKGPAEVSTGKQRFTLGKRESFTQSTDPQMVAWRRRVGNTILTVMKVKRVGGDGVLPIRISRVVTPDGILGEALEVYWMWSGFVELIVGNEKMWQDAQTRSLYLNYGGSLFYLLNPKEGVDNGKLPPSHWNTESPTKTTLIAKRESGNYPGRLEWLVSGKYGLYEGSASGVNVTNFARALAGEPRLSGEWIFVDSDFHYWFIAVGEDGYSGTATKLHTDLFPLVMQARQQYAAGSDELVQIEVHALAIAYATTTVWPIQFSGPTPEGKPLAYGWHANINGDEGCLVTHTTTTEQYVFDSHKYVLSLSKGQLTFSASIVESETKTWKLSYQAPVWGLEKKWIAGEAALIHCPWDMPDGGAGDATEAIIYSYYKDDDMIVDVKYTAEFDESYTEHSYCYDLMGNGNEGCRVLEGVNLTPNDYTTWTDRIKDTFEADGVSESAETGTSGGRRLLNFSLQTVEEEVFIPGLCCSTPSAIQMWVYDWWCCDGPGGYENHLADGGCYTNCPGPNSQGLVKIDRTEYRTLTKWDVEYEEGGSRTEHASIACIIPFDCVNGTIIVNGKNVRNLMTKKWGSKDWNSLVWKKKVTGTLVDCGSYTGPSCTGTIEGVIHPLRVGGPYFESKTDNEVHITRTYLHSKGNTIITEDPVIESGPEHWNLSTPWDGWLAKWAKPACGGLGAYMTVPILADAIWATANIALPQDGEAPAQSKSGWT